MIKLALNGMLLGGYFSGVEVTIRELVKNLCELPVKIHLILPSYATYKHDSPKLSLHPIKLPKIRAARIFWEHTRLPAFAKSIGCNLLHCPGYISPLTSSLPTVLTIHDCFAINNPQWCKRANRIYYQCLMPYSVKNAAQIIVPTLSVKQELLQTYHIIPDKVNIIPFAPSAIFSNISAAQQLQKIKNKYSLPDNYILHVGNHEPKKNIETLLQAFQRLKLTYKSSTKLVLANSSAWGTSVKKLISNLKLTDSVVITGYIDLVDLPAVYSLASCFVFPSRGEGFGIPVLEAMACNTPVICSNINALNEITGKSALKVNPANPDDLAEAIHNLLASEDMKKTLIAAGKVNSQRFSWQQTARKTFEIYQKTLTISSS